MKLLHLTDTEGFRPVIPAEFFKENAIEAVIITGDIAIGTTSLKGNARHFGKIRNAVPGDIPVYYIPGNREPPSTAGKFEGLPDNMIPLHNRIEIFRSSDGMEVYLVGLGGALPGFNNNFVISEEAISEKLTLLFSEIKKKLRNNNSRSAVILAVHNPPVNTKLDFALTTHEHIGSSSIREIIKEYEPDVCLCGHVHESAGIEKLGRTLCINPGASKFGNAAIVEISPYTDEIKAGAELIKIEVKR